MTKDALRNEAHMTYDANNRLLIYYEEYVKYDKDGNMVCLMKKWQRVTVTGK